MFRKIHNQIIEYKVYLLLFMLIICFTLITGFNGLYGQDSYEYLRFTSALIEFAKHGTNTGINYWPVLYPVCGVILSAVFKPLIALQLISVIAFVLSGIYLEKILKILYKKETRIIRLFVFLFFLLSPYLLRASITVMSDSLCLFFVTAAWYYFVRYKEEKKNIFFVCFTVFATAAISTRYAAFVVVIVPAVCALYCFFRRFSWKHFLLAVIGAALVVLPYVLVRKGSSADFFQNTWFRSWAFQNFFRSSFDSPDGKEVYTFPNIIYCFFNLVHPAYCFVGILFAAVSFRSFIKKGASTIQWLFIVSLLGYALFLAGIPFQDLRHLILSFPFVLVLFFPAFIEVCNRFKKMKQAGAILVVLLCVVIQLAFFVRVFIPFYRYNKTEKQISSEVVKYDGATLYTFSIDAAVRHYGYKGEIINIWAVRIDTLPVAHAGDLVLFNEKQFGEVWKNKNPMLNWEYLKTKYEIVKLEDLPDNWDLYSIKMPYSK